MSFEFTAPGRKSLIALAAAAAFLATAASAESIRLIKASHAEALHGDGFGMTAFYLAQGGLFEVVATFGERDSAKPAAQLRISLADGDDIEFVPPGRPDLSFRFVRSGAMVEVISDLADGDTVAKN